MNKATAFEIAARVWCDPEMADITMDVEKAERIADILAEIKDQVDKAEEA